MPRPDQYREEMVEASLAALASVTKSGGTFLMGNGNECWYVPLEFLGLVTASTLPDMARDNHWRLLEGTGGSNGRS